MRVSPKTSGHGFSSGCNPGLARQGLLLTLGAALGFFACQSPKRVTNLYVSVSEEAQVPVEASRLKAVVGAQLQSMPGYRLELESGSKEGWDLQVRLELATERPGEGEVRHRALGLTAWLVRLGRGEGQKRFVAEALATAQAGPDSSWDGLIASGVKKLMSRLGQAIELSTASVQALSQAIRSSDPYRRNLAVEFARTRKLPLLRMPLEKLLADKTLGPKELLKAASALAEFEDERSAPAIIDAVSRAPEYSVPLLFLLSKVGGREAEGYLHTVKSGHPDLRVRQAAADALKSVRGKAPAGISDEGLR